MIFEQKVTTKDQQGTPIESRALMEVEITDTAIKEKECSSFSQRFSSYLPGATTTIVYYSIKTTVSETARKHIPGYESDYIFHVERRYSDFEELQTYLRNNYKG